MTNGEPPKALPHDARAEMAVLGSMLLSEKATVIGLEKLRAQDFYVLRHRKVFEALGRLAAAGQPGCELVVVRHELERAGDLEVTGGAQGLMELCEVPHCSGDVEAHINIVVNKAAARAVVGLALQAVKANDPATDVDALVESLRRGLDGVVAAHESVPVIGEVLPAADALVERWARSERVGVMTGIAPLDRAMQGMLPETLTIIGAAPSDGKTALAANIALHVARTQGPVLFFSAEMPAVYLTLNMLSIESGVSWGKCRGGLFHADELARWQEAKAALGGLPLRIDGTPSVTMEQIERRTLGYVRQEGTVLVVVDYVQLLGTRALSRRYEQVARLSADLKGLARRAGIAVLVLSQITRNKEGDPHLRMAGELETDADVIVLLARLKKYEFGKPDTEPDVAMRRFRVGKNRMGRQTTFEMEFRKPVLRFYEVGGAAENREQAVGEHEEGRDVTDGAIPF